MVVPEGDKYTGIVRSKVLNEAVFFQEDLSYEEAIDEAIKEALRLI